MKRLAAFFLLMSMLAVCIDVRAAGRSKSVTLRYQVPSESTNVYHADIEIQGEAGKEAFAGDYVLNILHANSNYIAISARGQLRPKALKGMSPMGYNPGYGLSRNSWLMNSSFESKELVIDAQGNIVRQTGDLSLPIPLGQLLRSLAQKLPAGSGTSWEENQEVFIMDEPLLLGPAPVFLSAPGGMGYQPYFPGRGSQGVLSARQKVNLKVTDSTRETVTLQKTVALTSLYFTGHEPRVNATGEGLVILDVRTGWPRKIELSCKSVVITENLSRRSVLNLKWKLIEGAEREAALAPPTEAKPNPPDWTKLSGDLNSEDNFKRETGARQLSMSSNESHPPPPEILALMEKLTTDSSEAVRQAAFTMLANFGSSEHVPLLVRGLRSPDDAGVRLACAKGLGRLKDARAVGPLAELLASGQTDQFSGRSARQNAVMEAITRIGPRGESAVALLLKEKNIETLSEACLILKNIGTTNSLPALKELTAYPNKELSEIAADACRSIQSRGSDQ